MQLPQLSQNRIDLVLTASVNRHRRRFINDQHCICVRNYLDRFVQNRMLVLVMEVLNCVAVLESLIEFGYLPSVD